MVTVEATGSFLGFSHKTWNENYKVSARSETFAAYAAGGIRNF